MISPKFSSVSLVLLGGILAITSPVSAAWNVSGTVKSTTGTNLDGVDVTVKDSSSNLKSTSANGGQFSIVQTVGVLDRTSPLDFSVHQVGNELLIAFPGSGSVDLSLVDVSGAVLWTGKSALVEGYARTTLPVMKFVGPAILRIASGNQHASQLVTLLGANGIRLTPRVSARSMATFPTLQFKKTGYADTTYVMTAQNQSGITVMMRDNSQPQSTTCKLPSGPNSGSGSFTNYWFGQGTGKDGNYYKTACGYRGTEPSGQGSDQMNNLAFPQYFVAIPSNSSSDFNKVDMCGACVELTGSNGTKLIATVTDECPNDVNPPCKNNPNGHLDVSYPAFSKLGFSTGNPSGTNWKYVKCPVTGNVIIRVKSGNANQIYIENSILPIKDAKVGNNSATHLSYGPFQISRTAFGATVTLVDYSDRTLTITIPTSVGAETDYNTGVQFPACQ